MLYLSSLLLFKDNENVMYKKTPRRISFLVLCIIIVRLCYRRTQRIEAKWFLFGKPNMLPQNAKERTSMFESFI